MIRAMFAAVVLLSVPAQPAINSPGAEPIFFERPTPRCAGTKPPSADGLALSRWLVTSYPLAAVNERREGDVVLSMCIGPDGRARNVKLVKSSGHADLDATTLRGIASMRFHPACDAQNNPVDWCDPPLPMTVEWRIPR
jgi:TonB family protein